MSLKWFHIVFISLSMVLSLGFGLWALFNQQAALGVVSLGGSAALCVYGNYFLGKARRDRRMKRVGVVSATVALLAFASPALACPVCFGNPDSAQMKGVQAGILALLLVTVSVLAAIAGFFFVYLRRRIRIFEASNGGSY